MKIFWAGYLAFGVLYLGAFVMLHSAVCGMHAAAVEQLWYDCPKCRNEYHWSHTYCKAMARPADWLFGD